MAAVTLRHWFSNEPFTPAVTASMPRVNRTTFHADVITETVTSLVRRSWSPQSLPGQPTFAVGGWRPVRSCTKAQSNRLIGNGTCLPDRYRGPPNPAMAHRRVTDSLGSSARAPMGSRRSQTGGDQPLAKRSACGGYRDRCRSPARWNHAKCARHHRHNCGQPSRGTSGKPAEHCGKRPCRNSLEHDHERSLDIGSAGR
jgi:hypothetical protein